MVPGIIYWVHVRRTCRSIDVNFFHLKKDVYCTGAVKDDVTEILPIRPNNGRKDPVPILH